ncbi:DUF362 domain-containing protein [Kovacikia minuta CCNUW1]|uniref:DUF362 domain-containing protein n=1 Tax=Kovacikia minuta TaxID=2931930 RepID=UPI001CCF27E5|nr:DUF362 domain-containing protein [Kovacikia minuta]UBF23646.1 DUF362 domain-containing protein [Kovacikia minuta CCNUW1]
MAPDDLQRYHRRDLLRLAGLAAGAAALPVACRTTTSTADAPHLSDPATETVAATTATQPEGRVARAGTSRVVLVKTDDRVAGTRKALDLLQPDGISGKTVFLKPNYNTGDPAPAATDTALLEALIQELQNAKAGQISLGDRSGMAETRQAMQTKGVFKLAERYGVNAIVFDELKAEDWQYFPAEGTHWSKGFAFARPVLNAGAVVNTCCLKTHRFGGHFTLSLKNSVGMAAKYVPGDSYNYMNELHSSPHQRLMIAELNQAYKPALVLLDGVEALVNGGPEAGTKVKSGVILAGTDRVAVDVVAIGILRSFGTTEAISRGSVWQLEQIRRAVELGLGASNQEQIEIVSADSASRIMADQIRKYIVA